MRFDKYHPFINFLFFASVIAFTIMFNHPVFLMLSYICSFIYSVKLNRNRGLIFNLICILFIIVYPFVYSSYRHFGVTVITTNFIDNSITLESLMYGTAVSVSAISVVMWFSCVHSVFSSDKVIYLFGKLSHNLSLYLAIALRTVPQLKEEFTKTAHARACIGKGCGQGSPFRRIKSTVSVISIVIAWGIENFVEKARSMNNRGYKLKKKTTFSIYRFDNRDRSFVVLMCALITIIAVAAAFEQTAILYNPQIIVTEPTTASYVFYAAYAMFSLLPFILQSINEVRFKKAQAPMEKHLKY